MKDLKLVLASSSRWRKTIMEEMGLEFEVIAPDIDEKAVRFDDPVKLTRELAWRKAIVVVERLKERAVVIASDQVVTCEGVIREKPVSDEQAREYLRSYQKLPAQTVTSVVVINTQTRKAARGVDIATVHFKGLTDEVIERIIAEKIIFDCAGGFATGHPSFDPYVDRIEGERESIIGLPRKMTELLIAEVNDPTENL